MIKPSDARFCDALQHLAMRLPSDEMRRILVIGPGITDPLDAILAAFDSALLVAIEIHPDEAATLQSKWADHPNISIVCGDAAEQIAQGQDRYHLIVVRHPDIDRLTVQWTAVFAAACTHLAPVGMLLISTYSLPEVSLIRKCLSALSVTIEAAHGLTSQTVDLQGSDRYMLLCQKPTSELA